MTIWNPLRKNTQNKKPTSDTKTTRGARHVQGDGNKV
jgi:hypothetical protein